ncbi:MAG TPA: hypothetical protein VGH56_05615, partial [Solirubrobacteraceae bacterium]
MSDSPNNTITLAAVAPGEPEELGSGAVSDGPTQAAPEQLDSPIERTDLAASDTFIPEAVDQLLS